jgi:hypothetical protein
LACRYSYTKLAVIVVRPIFRTANVKNKFAHPKKPFGPADKKLNFEPYFTRKKHMTFQKFACLVLFLTISTAAFPQTTDTQPKETGRPDIPGTFVVEVGVNKMVSPPSNFSLGFWGSRTVNIYYQYDIRILKSRFALVPGIGLSLERFKFNNFRTLAYDAEDSLKLVLPHELVPSLPTMRKSQLITNYIEIPVEIKYSSNPEDPSRTFKASIGGRIGYLYDGFTKIKFEDKNEVIKQKDKQDWNLTKLRYGVFAKIGVGNFSLFTNYNLTNLFEDGKGPGLQNTVKDFNTFTVGISLSSF